MTSLLGPDELLGLKGSATRRARGFGLRVLGIRVWHLGFAVWGYTIQRQRLLVWDGLRLWDRGGGPLKGISGLSKAWGCCGRSVLGRGLKFRGHAVKHQGLAPGSAKEALIIVILIMTVIKSNKDNNSNNDMSTASLSWEWVTTGGGELAFPSTTFFLSLDIYPKIQQSLLDVSPSSDPCSFGNLHPLRFF